MLDERKAAILEAVVSEYVETAQPVGSAHLAQSGDLGVSAATVRNEMAALEHEGYLTQPHTSAGRVPTEKGYRFFVDRMAGRRQLRPEELTTVREFFAHAHGELEQMLLDTSRLLAHLTDLASVVVAPAADTATLRSLQLVGLSERNALLFVVLSTGAVERWMVDLPEGTTDDDLAQASARLTAAMRGRRPGTVVAPAPSGNVVVDACIHAALGCLRASGEATGPVFVGGTARVAKAFDAVDAVRRVLSILEESFVVVSLLRDVLDRGLEVAIGTEHGLAPLADCALVVAPYQADGEVLGSIAVVGPTRMNYPQAMAAVAVVSQRLGRYLGRR
jgi:heat-inducible transcriptional repressor